MGEDRSRFKLQLRQYFSLLHMYDDNKQYICNMSYLKTLVFDDFQTIHYYEYFNMLCFLCDKNIYVLQPESRGNWIITYHIKYNGRLNAIFILHCEQILRLPGYYLPASVVKMILHKSSLDYQ